MSKDLQQHWPIAVMNWVLRMLGWDPALWNYAGYNTCVIPGCLRSARARTIQYRLYHLHVQTNARNTDVTQTYCQRQYSELYKCALQTPWKPSQAEGSQRVSCKARQLALRVLYSSVNTAERLHGKTQCLTTCWATWSLQNMHARLDSKISKTQGSRVGHHARQKQRDHSAKWLPKRWKTGICFHAVSPFLRFWQPFEPLHLHWSANWPLDRCLTQNRWFCKTRAQHNYATIWSTQLFSKFSMILMHVVQMKTMLCHMQGTWFISRHHWSAISSCRLLLSRSFWQKLLLRSLVC